MSGFYDIGVERIDGAADLLGVLGQALLTAGRLGTTTAVSRTALSTSQIASRVDPALVDVVSTDGDQQATSAGTGIAGDISWNFEKFLISRDGRVLRRYPPETKPEDRGLMQDIAEAL